MTDHEDRSDCWCNPTVGWPGHPLGLVHRPAPSDAAAPLREALAKADEFLTRGSTFNGHTGPDPIAAHILIEEALGRDV